MNSRLPIVLGLLLGLAVMLAAPAAPPAMAEAEITHLLESVGQSGCDFYRNGSWHDPRSAEEHLRAKYEYLESRDKIITAEDFIEKAATESSLSGRPYLVRCSDGKVVTSNRWLHEALARYRSCSEGGAQCASRLTRDAPGLDVVTSGPKFSRPP